jgi:hypothetical protein
MQKLSEQLSDLSVRAKKTEDFVASAQQKDVAKIESEKTALAERAAAKREQTSSKWTDARSALDARFATIKANADERRFEKDVKKAEHRADQAEQDAADAIDFALYVLDQTEYTIADAVIARTDAEDLASNV